MVAANHLRRSADDLVRLLTELTATHEELLGVVDTKISACRAADADTIRRVVEQESALVARIEQRDGLRRQLIAQIAKAYGVNAVQARRWSIRRLAERVGGSDATRLLAAGERLRTVVGDVARRNRVAQLIADGVLRHVRQAFAALTDEEATSAGYVRDGEVRTMSARIFEMVG